MIVKKDNADLKEINYSVIFKSLLNKLLKSDYNVII